MIRTRLCQNKYPLEQVAWLFSRRSPETSEVFHPSSVKNVHWTRRFNSDRLEEVSQSRLFLHHVDSRQFRCWASIDVWVSQGANNSHDQRKRLAFFPQDHGEAIRAFVVWSGQSIGLLVTGRLAEPKARATNLSHWTIGIDGGHNLDLVAGRHPL